MKQQKRKLRIYISNTYTPSKPEGEDSEKVASWELRVEGKLLEEVSEWRCFFFLIFKYVLKIFFSACLCLWKTCIALLLADPSVWLRPCNQMCVHSSLHPTPQLLVRISTQTLIHTGTHSCSLLKQNWNHELRHVSPPFISSLCHLGPHEGYFSFYSLCFLPRCSMQACVGVLHGVSKKREIDVGEEVLMFANCQGVGRFYFSFLAVCSFVLTPPPLMRSELNNVATQT